MARFYGETQRIQKYRAKTSWKKIMTAYGTVSMQTFLVVKVKYLWSPIEILLIFVLHSYYSPRSHPIFSTLFQLLRSHLIVPTYRCCSAHPLLSPFYESFSSLTFNKYGVDNRQKLHHQPTVRFLAFDVFSYAEAITVKSHSNPVCRVLQHDEFWYGPRSYKSRKGALDPPSGGSCNAKTEV